MRGFIRDDEDFICLPRQHMILSEVNAGEYSKINGSGDFEKWKNHDLAQI